MSCSRVKWKIKLTIFHLQTLLAMDMHLLRIPLEDRRPLRKALLIFAVVLLAVFGVLTVAMRKYLNGETSTRSGLTERVAERYPENVVPLSRTLTELVECFLVGLSPLTRKQESPKFSINEERADKSAMSSPSKEDLNAVKKDRINKWEDKVLNEGSVSPYLTAGVTAQPQSPNLTDCECNCLNDLPDYQVFIFPIYLCVGLFGIAILIQLVHISNSKQIRNNVRIVSSISNGLGPLTWKRIFSAASDFNICHHDGKTSYRSICATTKISLEKYFTLVTDLLIKAWNNFVVGLKGSIVFLVLVVRVVMDNDLFLEFSDWLNPPAEPITPELVKFMQQQNEKNLAILAAVEAILQLSQRKKGQRGRRSKKIATGVSPIKLTPYRQLASGSEGPEYSDVTLDEQNVTLDEQKTISCISNDFKSLRTLTNRFPCSVLNESESDFSSRRSSSATTMNGIDGDNTPISSLEYFGKKASSSGSPTSSCSSWRQHLRNKPESSIRLTGYDSTKGKNVFQRSHNTSETYLKTLWIEPENRVQSAISNYETRSGFKDKKECIAKTSQPLDTKSLQHCIDELYITSESCSPIRNDENEASIQRFKHMSRGVSEIINEKIFIGPAERYPQDQGIPQKTNFSNNSEERISSCKEFAIAFNEFNVGNKVHSSLNEFDKPISAGDGSSLICDSVIAADQDINSSNKVGKFSTCPSESSISPKTDTVTKLSACSPDHFNYAPHKTLSSKQRLASCVGNEQFYQPFSLNSSEIYVDGSTNTKSPNRVRSRELNSSVSDDRISAYNSTPNIRQPLDSFSSSQATSSSSERDSVEIILPSLLCGGRRLSSDKDRLSYSNQSGSTDDIHFQRPPAAVTSGCIVKAHSPATDNISSRSVSRSARRSSMSCSYSTGNTYCYEKPRATYSLCSRSDVGLVNPSAGNMRCSPGTSSLRSLPMYRGRSTPDSLINPHMSREESGFRISMSVKKQTLLSNICIPTAEYDSGGKDSSTSFSSIGSHLLPGVKDKELERPDTDQTDLVATRRHQMSYRKYDSIDTSL